MSALAWTPEWPVTICVALSWAALVFWMLPRAELVEHHVTSSGGWTSLGRWAIDWTVMSFAMMIPVTLPAIRHVSMNTIRVRRRRAVALYVAAYLGLWLSFGLAAAIVLAATDAAGTSRAQVLIATLLVAAAWQLTRTKRRAIIACRRTIALPPQGPRADYACMRFALVQGVRCTHACWPLMFLMALVPHELAVMVVVTLIVVAEERLPYRDRLIRPMAAVYAAACIVVMATG